MIRYLLFWWFLYQYAGGYNNRPTVIGPFASQAQCEWYRTKVVHTTFGCWEA